MTMVASPGTRALRMRLATIIGALLVALFAAWWASKVLGTGPLDVHNLRWVWGDLAQVHVAWSQYLSDTSASWLTTLRVSYPEPISISLFDPMPLLLLLAKPFANLVTPGTQYFGYYFMACLVLQGVFGYLAALRTLRLTGQGDELLSRYAAVLIGILFASIPYTFYRFQGHTALSSQWVLVISIWVALSTLDWKGRAWVLANGAVVVLATGLNPYLALLVLISNGSLVIMSWSTLGWRQVAVRLGSMAALAAFGLWVFGFMGGTTASTSGYGIYSMNLLGPFDSNGSAALLPLDVPDPTGGQSFEGYTYLGLGVLALGAITLLVCLNHRLQPSRFPFMSALLVVLLCTIVAVSTTITLAGHALEVPVPRSINYLLSRFRGSGRLFWMAGFWLLLIFLAASSLRLGLRRLALLLTAVVAVQLLDIRTIGHQVRLNIDSYQSLRLTDVPSGNYTAIFVYPAWQCDHQATPGGVRNYESVGHLAASIGIPTNNFYAARTPDKQTAYHCDYAARLKTIDPGAVYLVSGALLEQHRSTLTAAHECTPMANSEGAWKCLPKPSR
ncbi:MULTISPECIES: DUF6311 domain-containing protein [Stenotrophomonas]|uniref:DUF6311 domain-containing protein n=1 Tax=Stenotrophomonas TaxID=40323 RepID=UPI0013789DCD|nr:MULTISPECIES: DUF6311 domain-containing protein [Stenotrophomonas]MBH1689685.1 hypothetical protein [Stenotrophomonas maltophilia]MBH1707128.1 hypothetical protein [Stenotrophomonas maltophilia]MBH1847894.1 hypothetical protein [Stenotrophomonas maltophilia]MBL0732975.1 hypothetical protein [Stenotrophomonas maltophilia]MBL0758373.1 hypothetical protein [Stenotrophomonas maltophilia]